MPASFLLIRIVHWIVAIGVVINTIILVEGDLLHEIIGYLVLGLVLLRVLMYKNYRSRLYPKFGSYLYFLIWSMIIVLGISGFCMGLDYFWGNSTLDIIHLYSSNFLAILVLFHLITISYDTFKYKRPSWKLMFNGKIK